MTLWSVMAWYLRFRGPSYLYCYLYILHTRFLNHYTGKFLRYKKLTVKNKYFMRKVFTVLRALKARLCFQTSSDILRLFITFANANSDRFPVDIFPRHQLQNATYRHSLLLQPRFEKRFCASVLWDLLQPNKEQKHLSL